MLSMSNLFHNISDRSLSTYLYKKSSYLENISRINYIKVNMLLNSCVMAFYSHVNVFFMICHLRSLDILDLLNVTFLKKSHPGDKLDRFY